MDIFSVLSLLGGVAFFLFGMHIMSSGLEKMSGGKLEKVLRQATSNPTKSLVLGAGITIAIQSSSAVTVMLIGLVNSGIMTLRQTIGVIMGSNIGTTLTAWILALAGIEGDNLLLTLLKPESFAPVFAVIGIVLLMLSKRVRYNDLGNILLGFSILMFGMIVMGDAVSVLEDNEKFKSMLVAFSNPILGVLVGAVFTGIIQSSTASVGVLQTIAATVGITYGAAIPIIMGQNIGTCVTALIASIGTNKNARRVGVVHIYFNIIGTVLFLCLIYLVHAFFPLRFLTQNTGPAGIAVIHSIFNIASTAIIFPFTRGLEKLAILTIPDKSGDDQKFAFLDQRLLNTPSFALAQCKSVTVEMAAIARNAILKAIPLVGNYNEKTAQVILEDENMLDMYEDKLGEFLIQLARRELTERDSREVSEILHLIGDLERIGDHACNILESAQELHEKKISFSPLAQADLSVLTAALTEIVEGSIRAFENDDEMLAKEIEPLEEVIDELVLAMRDRHIARLTAGECNIEQGFVWNDLLVNFERVSDHCSHIAVSVIQVHADSLEAHEYLNVTRRGENQAFVSAVNAYREKYVLADAKSR